MSALVELPHLISVITGNVYTDVASLMDPTGMSEDVRALVGQLGSVPKPIFVDGELVPGCSVVDVVFDAGTITVTVA